MTIRIPYQLGTGMLTRKTTLCAEMLSLCTFSQGVVCTQSRFPIKQEVNNNYLCQRFSTSPSPLFKVDKDAN